MKNTLSMMALICTLSLSACSKKNEDTVQNLPDREEAINEPTVAKGAEPIGVDVCDQFLEKYQDCVAHMPGNIREHMQKGLDSTERAWRATVAKSKDNLALEKSCNELQASVARATKAQGCSW